MVTAAAAVRAAGGNVTRELPIIDAVAATLTPDEAGRLPGRCRGCRVYADRATRLGGPGRGFPTLIGANLLHRGVTGKGVTVAVIDSGFLNMTQYQKNSGARRESRPSTTPSRTASEPRTASPTTSTGTARTSRHRASSKKTLGAATRDRPRRRLVRVEASTRTGEHLRVRDQAVDRWSRTRTSTKSASSMRRSGARRLLVLGRPDEPGHHRGLAGRDRGGRVGRQHRPERDDHPGPGNVPYVITVGAITGNYTPLYGKTTTSPRFRPRADLQAPPSPTWSPRPATMSPGSRGRPRWHQVSPTSSTAEQLLELSGTSQRRPWSPAWRRSCCQRIPRSLPTTSSAG